MARKSKKHSKKQVADRFRTSYLRKIEELLPLMPEKAKKRLANHLTKKILHPRVLHNEDMLLIHIVAYVRHHHTQYHELLKTMTKQAARREVKELVKQILQHWGYNGVILDSESFILSYDRNRLLKMAEEHLWINKREAIIDLDKINNNYLSSISMYIERYKDDINPDVYKAYRKVIDEITSSNFNQEVSGR